MAIQLRQMEGGTISSNTMISSTSTPLQNTHTHTRVCTDPTGIVLHMHAAITVSIIVGISS